MTDIEIMSTDDNGTVIILEEEDRELTIVTNNQLKSVFFAAISKSSSLTGKITDFDKMASLLRWLTGDIDD